MNKSEEDLQVQERIDLYLNGKLGQDQIDDLWVEIIENPENYDYLHTSAALRKIISPKSEATRTPSYSLSKWQQCAAAAGFALIMGITAIYLTTSSLDNRFGPLDSLDFTSMRSGTEVVTSETDRQMLSAVYMAVKGEYDVAILLLNDIYERSTHDPVKSEALMNIGIIEYNSDQFASAIRTFTQITQNHTADILTLERAYWYLAQSQMASGDMASARESIETVISIDGAHSRMAKNYLRYLRE